MINVIFKRAVRGFLAGFIAGMTTQLALGTTISTIEDLKKFSISLAVAGMTGGLMALDKLIRYKEPDIEVRAIPDDSL